VTAFACTLCGKCCLNLEERDAPAWPDSFDTLAPFGLYGLPTRAGLPVWSWERGRMMDAAERRGVPIAFVPSLVAIDREQVIVLVWELATRACPLHVSRIASEFPPPVRPREDGTVVLCGAYEERPAVCRAYPVLIRGTAAAWSAKCPDAFAPDAADRAGFAATYTDSFAAAEVAARIPAVVRDVLRFLETTRDLALVRGLDRDAALDRVRKGPVVDLVDRLSRGGPFSPADLAARVAAVGG